jgi:hypothetical protein
VATLVVTALLPERGRGFLYDPEVTDGQILVGVESPSADTIAALETALAAPPGARLKSL